MDKRHLPAIVLYVLASVFALAVLGIGIFWAFQPSHNPGLLAAGCVTLVLVAVTWPLYRSSGLRNIDSAAAEKLVHPLAERIDQISILLNLMSEQQLLSDRAKSVAFREKDREAVRRAIQEDLYKGDFEGAATLADDVEKSFGYRAEAEHYRQDIAAKQQEVVRKQVNEVVMVIDRYTRSEQWNGALREAERLLSMFPDNEQVKNLPHEIDARRQAHKKQLLTSWNEAVARHDVDGSIEILKQLDAYLTPAEAESMQETARGVFKEKLAALSSQFANQVRDQNWAEAVKTGEQITRDFPNTRAAQEVREKMDLLKQRATQPATPVATA
ncbi:MAG TPA: hypothetical protein VHY37_14270 [Tepidisphaeraceae bacterium]|nr:hypothetical protein [Tepidisphaeraceae bacterium]